MTSAAPLPGATRILQDGIARGLHSGAQLFVSLRGEPIANLALGDRAPRSPMTTHTILPWMSAGKPVAAVAVAILQERGLLALDDTVAKYLPGYAASGKEAVTLRHLLTHTGGQRLVESQWRPAPYEEIVASICEARQDPGWIPGEKAGYHPASSWFILAEVVRIVDGRQFDRFAIEEVFRPAGMSDSCFTMTDSIWGTLEERIGFLYETTTKPPTPLPWTTRPHCAQLRPGASARGPAVDLARFYEMLLAGGNGILRPETIKMFSSRHRVGKRDITFQYVMDWGLGFMCNSQQNSPEPPPYGFGRHASPATFGHGGMQSSMAFCDPAYGLVVTWICNGTPGDTQHQKRNRAINEAVYEDLALA
ncbi:MAG: beta-lactamase family protein [Candidatus Sumerlaeaceae bacterium]|nr:beta-lactamase family protein [Candidatus Sumerlaeaceae bacterium]